MALRPLRSRIQYKIIVPFLLLTLLVALAGSTAAFLFVTGNAQERLNNQLAQTARVVADAIVRQENSNLTFLRELAFAGPNAETGAPAVADALANGDTVGLSRAVEPFVRISQRRGVRLDRLVLFDSRSQAVLHRERDPHSSASWIDLPSHDMSGLWFVQRILAGVSDARGDKYAGLLDVGDGVRYLFTAVPIKQGERIVGGAIVATRLEGLLADLAAQSQSAITTVYDPATGRAFASSIEPVAGLSALDSHPDLVERLVSAPDYGMFDTVMVNERQYQLAFAPLVVRGDIVGALSVALASDYVIGPWSDMRSSLVGLTTVLMAAIVGLGVFIARQITRPVEELLSVAQDVTGGNLDRRSTVKSDDEIGKLASAFNTMTSHLLALYSAVRAEAGRRAAIVESITDGVIVCDAADRIELLNPAARRILDLSNDDPPPATIAEVRVEPLGAAAPHFGGAHSPDLFRIGERVVRVVRAPVFDSDGETIATVVILHDMTDDVAIDRAKTNFIATISHELRTPLTIISGNASLLARQLAGPLSEEQQMLIDGIHAQSRSMISLVNNVITIAGLDSGSLTFDVEPIALAPALQRVLWSTRKSALEKGLVLEVDIPDDLPEVLADAIHLPHAIAQVLDNAVRYTSSGSVRLTARHQGGRVRIDIQDSGPGISPEQRETLFKRFSRGEEGLNSPERGIGLGLAIASELIQRQGGVIWLEHSSSEGSTFSLTLPCVTDEAAENHHAPVASAA
jgi:signal transduction histidine kinase